jgi:hypothetical protein
LDAAPHRPAIVTIVDCVLSRSKTDGCSSSAPRQYRLPSLPALALTA